MTVAARARPSGWWYLLAPLLVAAGVAWAGTVGLSEAKRLLDDYELLDSDGRGSVVLEQGDEATVFAFWKDGRPSDSVRRPDAIVEVIGPDREPVSFKTSSGRTTFSIDQAAGIAVGTFVAPSAGTHEVVVRDGAGAGPGPGVVGAPSIGVARLDLGGLVGRVVKPIGMGFGAAVLTIVLLTLLRSTSRQRDQKVPENIDGGSGPFL